MRSLAPRLPADPGTDELIPLYRRLPRIASHFEDLDQPDQFMELLGFFDRKPYFAIKNWTAGGGFSSDDAKDEKARWHEFREDVALPLLQAWRVHRYAPVMRMLFAAREVYDRMRAERGCLNFQDLLMRAAALLRGKPHVRRYFAGRFTHLLVDEFQDTDPIQAEVMLLLTATDPAETDWRNCRPRPGSLFVVGDPKQSIYRFRRADIVTYNEVKDILLKEGLLAHLSANFRSTGAVIDWVNQVFEPLGDGGDPSGPLLRFPREDRPESPTYVPLLRGRQDEDTGSLSGVVPLRIPEGPRMEESIAYEADRIARTIRNAIDRGMTVARTARQLEQGIPPEVGPSDFMIITRRNRYLGVYARALQAYGIPHRVSGGSALNEVGELRLLHFCLRALARPDDPVALVAALRSELFGVSDADLFAFKQSGGRFSFHAPVPEGLDAAAREALTDAFSRLLRYEEWLNGLPLLAALERITADLGLAVLAAAQTGGDVQAGSLAKALEVLRAAQAEMWTLAQTEEYLSRLVEAEEKYDGISALSQERPAVRVMNLHRVKGLESPVVFLADPGGDVDHPVELHVDRSGPRILGRMAIWGEARGSAPARLLACPAGWKQAEESERAFVNAENLRLRYVAATRACSALVITQRVAKGRDNNPWRYFQPFLEVPEIPDPGPQAAPVEPAEPLGPGEAALARSSIAERLGRCEAPTYDARAGKEFALARPSLFPPRETDGSASVEGGGIEAGGADGAANGGGESAEGEHGLEWGTVIHLLLEAAAREPGSDLEALAAAALAETGQDAGLAGAAVEMVRAVTGSEIWRRSLAAPRRLTEVPFHYLLDEDVDGVPTLLRGSVDLAFEEEGSWVLVDYKTDAVEGTGRVEALGRRYAPQLRLYARAWEACTGRPVRETLLYFIRPGALLRVE